METYYLLFNPDYESIDKCNAKTAEEAKEIFHNRGHSLTAPRFVMSHDNYINK